MEVSPMCHAVTFAASIQRSAGTGDPGVAPGLCRPEPAGLTVSTLQWVFGGAAVVVLSSGWCSIASPPR